jgi:hypothetical protein
MPAKYQKMGIAFQYPENWTLDEEDALAGRHAITVVSPGGAFFSVAVHPHSADPIDLAKAAVDVMQEEYEGLEIEEVRETLDRRELVGYDLNFFFLDLTNTARIRCLRTHSATYSIFCQGEDREFDRHESIFRAMTASLLEEMKDARLEGA